MKRSEVRAFVERGVIELNKRVKFNAGRLSEFNSEEHKEFPYAWLFNLQASTELPRSLPIDDWSITIRIAMLDTMDSIPAQYEPLVDSCDYIAQELIKILNDNLTESKLITITGISRPPFYKVGDDCMTGVDLSFVLNTPDKTSFC